MQKKTKKSNWLLNSVVIALVAVSTLSASVMAGCSIDKNNTKETKVVSETQIVTDIETVTEIVTDSEGNTIFVEKNKDSDSKAENGGSADSDKNTDNEKSEKDDTEKSESKGDSANKSESADNSDKSDDSSSNKPADKGDSSEVLSIDGNKYSVGDTVTCRLNVTTPKVVENYQATVTYDSDYLEVTKAKLVSPAAAGGILNYKNAGVIKFNGSNISDGYDYTGGGAIVEITYKVKSAGSTTPRVKWEIIREATVEGNGTNYADGGLSSEFVYS